MGVVESIPDDLAHFYGDDYYNGGGLGQHETNPLRGYSDYSFTAEHAVAWAAAFLEVLCPHGGAVLDVGCADGHLLAKLDTRYARFGLEVNPNVGNIAQQRGITILGRDLLDPMIIQRHRGTFDIVTAIAVFEHLRDIRLGVATALDLLHPEGILLFEVPLLSAVHDNRVWLTSSLEHVWYPTESALHHLLETELGASLIGTELFISGYGSTYIGVVVRGNGNIGSVQSTVRRLLALKGEPTSKEEARARMLLTLVHAAHSTGPDLDTLATLPAADLNLQLLQRLAQLWKNDLCQRDVALAETHRAQSAREQEVAHTRVLQKQLTSAQAEIERIEALRNRAEKYASRLQSDLDVAALDRTRSHTELTTVVVATEARLAAVERQLAAQMELVQTIGQERAALEQQHADLAIAAARLSDATVAAERYAALEAEFAALLTSRTWRLAALLHKTARRYPRIARLAVHTNRLARKAGRLPLRLRQRGIHQVRIPVSEDTPPASLPPPTVLQPVKKPAFLAATGHRPAPNLDCPHPGASESPLVSVVITSFNYGRFVTEAVDSVLNQTFCDLEVIVVEGGSSNPDSRFVVAGLHRPRTRVLMQGSGHSAGANRNYGISQSRGRYVCCLDADDALAPTYIEKAVYLLERHGYDVVSSALEKFGTELGTIDIMEQPDLAAMLEGNNVLTCAVYRRSLWEQSGGYRDFDRTLTGYVYEDWAFWVRVAALGARFRNLFQDPMLKYRIHGPSLSRGNDVLPMWKQRYLIRQSNEDVLQNIPEQIARSRKRASWRAGTPLGPPPIIDIGGPAAGGHHAPALLLALPFLILGGAERLLSGIVAYLVRQGWRVVIITSVSTGTEHGDATPWFEQHTKEIFHLPRAFPPEMWGDFIDHLIRSRAIDVFWVVGSAAAYDLLRALRATHPELRVADLLFNTVGHTKNNRRRRDLIDLIFVENREVREWLLERNEDPGRIRLIESGVNLAELRPTGRSKDFVRAIKASTTDLIVGFSGRWSEEKNPLGFIEIARLVDPSLPVRFVMTGTGHMRGAIERAISEVRFSEGRFHLLGPVPDITPVLGSFDLLVLPSVLDGRPVVVLEALAMGVPVLASRVGALPELVQTGLNGWLCEPTDVGAFVTHIEHIARNRTELDPMRRQARNFAQVHLDAQTMWAAYEQGLSSLLAEGARHD